MAMWLPRAASDEALPASAESHPFQFTLVHHE
jgi:hypothetical protein